MMNGTERLQSFSMEKNTTELTGKFFTEEYKLRRVLESIPTGHDYFSS